MYMSRLGQVLTVCVVQAVEDGTLEETEAKKQRKRKKKPNTGDGDDTTSKVHVQCTITT